MLFLALGLSLNIQAQDINIKQNKLVKKILIKKWIQKSNPPIKEPEKKTGRFGDSDVSLLNAHEKRLIRVCREIGYTDNAQLAYVLATAKLETASWSTLEEYYSHYWYTYQGGPKWHG
jgi:hypothetical protein